MLKSKAAEQDKALHSDSHIIALNKQLDWFKQEFENQMSIKEKNEEEINRLRRDIRAMREETSQTEVEVKAARRQNKLLAANLLKQE